MRSLLCCGLAALALSLSLAATADILVGESRGTGADAVGPLLRFGVDQTGNVAPRGVLTTDTGGQRLNTPLYASYDGEDNVVFVSDFYGKAIRVYPAGANGNVAPLRTLTTEYLGQPRHVAVDTVNDEILLPVMGCCIGAFDRYGSGNVGFPRRLISWGGVAGNVTRLNSPLGLAVLPNDEIVVADRASATPGTTGVLLYFARTATGNTAPLRALEGPATQLGDYVAGVIYRAQSNELIVSAVQGGQAKILTFPAGASGNTAPTRVLQGSGGIESPTAITYEPDGDLIYINAGAYSSSSPRVLAFPRTASGTVAPVRVLAGATTQVQQPYGLVSVPGDRIFRNGFQL